MDAFDRLSRYGSTVKDRVSSVCDRGGRWRGGSRRPRQDTLRRRRGTRIKAEYLSSRPALQKPGGRQKAKAAAPVVAAADRNFRAYVVARDLADPAGFAIASREAQGLRRTRSQGALTSVASRARTRAGETSNIPPGRSSS